MDDKESKEENTEQNDDRVDNPGTTTEDDSGLIEKPQAENIVPSKDI